MARYVTPAVVEEGERLQATRYGGQERPGDTAPGVASLWSPATRGSGAPSWGSQRGPGGVSVNCRVRQPPLIYCVTGQFRCTLYVPGKLDSDCDKYTVTQHNQCIVETPHTDGPVQSAGLNYAADMTF